MRIVATENVAAFQQFARVNAQYLESTGIYCSVPMTKHSPLTLSVVSGVDEEVLLSKMRTLTLCDVGSTTPHVSYDDLQRLLEVCFRALVCLC